MRVAELFQGAGGMALGFKRAGWETVWSAELAEFPSRITRYHWPHVPQYGDVATLDGRELVERHGAIDCLAGGSPCQDLSVAGKRAGLAGARSGLFHHQMRLWDETGAPLCLWENVAGALSSHNGQDFAAVLSAFVGAPVAVPRDGWTGERSSGVVSGPAGVAAWRLLDAQYFGVAQRRLRVFVLGARAGVCDPAQVLLEPEGVYGDPPTRGEAGEGSARSAGNGAKETRGVIALDMQGGKGKLGIRTDNVSHALGADSQPHAVLAFHHTQDPISGPSAPCLGAEGLGVLAWDDECNAARELMGTLPAKANSGQSRAGIVAFDTVQITSAANRSRVEPGLPSPTLNGSGLVHVAGVPEFARCVTAGEGARGDYETTTMLAPHGIPRRLTPRECERLMSWPDDWTSVPDEKGKPASDAQRYKAIGNGVVSNVAQWIAARTAHFYGRNQ